MFSAVLSIILLSTVTVVAGRRYYGYAYVPLQVDTPEVKNESADPQQELQRLSALQERLQKYVGRLVSGNNRLRQQLPEQQAKNDAINRQIEEILEGSLEGALSRFSEFRSNLRKSNRVQRKANRIQKLNRYLERRLGRVKNNAKFQQRLADASKSRIASLKKQLESLNQNLQECRQSGAQKIYKGPPIPPRIATNPLAVEPKVSPNITGSVEEGGDAANTTPAPEPVTAAPAKEECEKSKAPAPAPVNVPEFESLPVSKN